MKCPGCGSDHVDQLDTPNAPHSKTASIYQRVGAHVRPSVVPSINCRTAS